MRVNRLALDGFWLDLPPSWSGLDDVTYSDPSTLPPVALAADGGAGRMMVAEMLFEDPDEQPPGAEVDEMEALARAWGRKRRLEPIETCAAARSDGVVATATYLVRGCFVQVWYLSNGERVMHASYVCPWDARSAERADREAIVASLRWS